MTVQSKELKNGEIQEPRYRSPTAIVRPAVAVYYSVRLLQFIAWALLAMSTFGNYITFIGGWQAWKWDWWRPVESLGSITWSMVFAAVAYQGVFAVLQWGTKALRWWLVYGLALIASAIPSFLTYNAWAGPFFAAHIGAIFAAIVIGLASIGADALPEWVLVG